MKTKNLLPKILVITLAFIVISLSSFSQIPDWQWAKSAVGSAADEGECVIADGNGNTYVSHQWSEITSRLEIW